MITISLIDTALIKEFSVHDSRYKKFNFKVFESLIGDGGVIFSWGESWKNQRKIITQSFHYELLKDNVPKIIKEAET